MLKNELRKNITVLQREEAYIAGERRRLERLHGSLPGKLSGFIPQRDERVLAYRWALRKSVKQTAEEFGLSPGRVSQITKGAEVLLLG